MQERMIAETRGLIDLAEEERQVRQARADARVGSTEDPPSLGQVSRPEKAKRRTRGKAQRQARKRHR